MGPAAMGDTNQTQDNLQSQVNELMNRVEELCSENDALCKICEKNGISYTETLAALRHRLRFVRSCATHPIATPATASDVLTVFPLGHHVVEFSGTLMGVVLVSRAFLPTWKEVTVVNPWRFGYARVAATLQKHQTAIRVLAVMPGGRLASATDGIVRIWHLETGVQERVFHVPGAAQ